MAPTCAPAVRRAVIEQRLPSHAWPVADLLLTVVDVATGRRRALTAADGVPLVDAVAASCAVPLAWPPVQIGADVYIDGGVHGDTNADLALGWDPVVVLAPMVGMEPAKDVARELARLEASATVLTLSPDAEAAAQIGPDPLDLGTIARSAEAGRQQAARLADAVARVWPARAA